MNFEFPEAIRALATETRAFVTESVIPFEDDPRWGDHGPSDDLRRELNDLARRAGLFGPHIPRELGGLGLGHLDRAAVFEAAGYSLLGPVALHCAAPDEGNIHLLDQVANDRQKDRYLTPLAQGERSCFAMTEPDGAGSDPGMLRTTARPVGGDYVIDGRKWLITGARGAQFVIIMAKMQGGEADGRATMFLSPMDRPEIRIVRDMHTIDSSFAGGHCVVDFADLRLGADAVLGAVGKGFEYAQVRLAPARLTHCMRWLGAAARAHDIALRHAAKRKAFGTEIGRHEGVGFMLADNEIDMRSARLSLQEAAWRLDRGERGATVSSMAKVQCSEAIWRVVDNAVQVLGGIGISRETAVERIFREVRGFRIYDGPSEVHRWSLARKAMKRVAAEGQEDRR